MSFRAVKYIQTLSHVNMHNTFAIVENLLSIPTEWNQSFLCEKIKDSSLFTQIPKFTCHRDFGNGVVSLGKSMELFDWVVISLMYERSHNYLWESAVFSASALIEKRNTHTHCHRGYFSVILYSILGCRAITEVK